MVELVGSRSSGPPDEVVLRRELDYVASQHWNSEIVGVTRAPFPVVGSYDCYAISLELRDGSSRSVFWKDFTRSRQSKDEPETRRSREIGVYRDLLTEADLGTPAYYGSVSDPASGRFWLLIELVEGEPVSEANLALGSLAVAWLARMHAHFATRSGLLDDSDDLRRIDAAFFERTAERAMDDAAAISPAAARQLERALRTYLSSVEMLGEGPRTLVHGGFIPWHLLVDRNRDPVRVCVYDWELAGIGSPLYDLAFFADDADASTRSTLVDRYLTESARHGCPLPDVSIVGAAVEWFRLHRVMEWLSRSVEKAYPEAKVEWLADRAVELGGALRR